MNIDEIRAEAKSAFENVKSLQNWIGDKLTYEDFIGDTNGEIAANILISWAYEAGVKRGGEISISALNEVELRENPLYQKGYEEGEKQENYASGWLGGYTTASKDPSAWYVLDKNGEPLCFGDTFRRGKVEEIIYQFDMSEDGTLCVNGHYAHCCEKVIPDTREKIKDELSDVFTAVIGADLICYDETLSPNDIAEQFISRIEALGE